MGHDGEERLAGGMDPASRVVRVGDTVRRPRTRPGRRTRAAPPPRGRRVRRRAKASRSRRAGAREVLVVRRRRRAPSALSPVGADRPGARGPRPAAPQAARRDSRVRGRRCSLEWADPRGGPVVCHNDLFPENAVLRDGRVVALVDFAEAAPWGGRLWDLAIAAQEWAPLHAPGSRLDHPDDLDGVRRTGSAGAGLRPRPLAGRGAARRRRRGARALLAHIRSPAAAGREPWCAWWSGRTASAGPPPTRRGCATSARPCWRSSCGAEPAYRRAGAAPGRRRRRALVGTAVRLLGHGLRRSSSAARRARRGSLRRG